ncbi:MAG: LysR family transcriptional regulator [Streptomyces sp.]|jgi:DNA-binding transcriptional LysR family regulator|uniref:LysR family transcriptional regulator n=1 Tax=Streptomyces sp. TaxID=1931 RepID=UPI0025D6BEC8|nr:LysR substrate-binding domain-containing protein [Streptomyces sp.]MBW8794857.1 LysR family transcriptional regulator [Streptomyces sp.]
MDLDLRKVRYFTAVAELLHFGRAAERLHIAQPVLSRQIRALEKDLGAELFVRDSHGVTLTDGGYQLLEEARQLLAAADGARRRVVQAARGRRRLVVGFRAGVVVTRALRAFTAAHPDVEANARRVEWDDQEDLILDGTVDIAYVRLPVREAGLELRPLYSEPRVAMLPDRHRLAGKQEISLSDLDGERWLRYNDPRPGDLPLRTIEEKFECVAAGTAITMVPRSAAEQYSRSDIVYVPVVDAEPDRVLLAWAAGRRSPLVAAFAEAAARVAGAGADSG